MGRSARVEGEEHWCGWEGALGGWEGALGEGQMGRSIGVDVKEHWGMGRSILYKQVTSCEQEKLRMGRSGWVPRKHLTLGSYPSASQELPVRG